MSENVPDQPKKLDLANRLPLMLLWGLSPALVLALAGLVVVMMDTTPPERAFAHSLTLLGICGGPVVLLAWSVRLLWWTDRSNAAKILWALPLAVVACAVNLFLAFGACSVLSQFKPDFWAGN